MTTYSSRRPAGQYRPQRQRGISLIAVLSLLLLSLMAVMGAFRVANLNESMLGSTSDYNRAFAAAEALMRDAEMDIRGRRPPYIVNSDKSTGFPCRPNPPSSTTSLDTVAGYLGCRNAAAANTPWFPMNSEDFDIVTDIVAANALRCKEGICAPLNTTALANLENDLANMSALGATYGRFTRQNTFDTAPGVSSNPILAPTDGVARGWYWVELFRYNSASSDFGTVIPSPSKPFIYRITVVTQGLKPGTRVVLRSLYVPFPKPPPT